MGWNKETAQAPASPGCVSKLGSSVSPSTFQLHLLFYFEMRFHVAQAGLELTM